MRLDQLSYANQNQPRFKRWIIRSIEGLSGRDRYFRLYQTWSREIVPQGRHVFSRMLELINIRLDIRSEWPPRNLPDGPLVIIANHPYGIGDGIAVLAMAEALGRPFRVLINNDLMKVPEIAPFALPISFDETREAMAINMATRQQAVEAAQGGRDHRCVSGRWRCDRAERVRSCGGSAVEDVSRTPGAGRSGIGDPGLFRGSMWCPVPSGKPGVADVADIAAGA
jgi:hypothetical protein